MFQPRIHHHSRNTSVGGEVYGERLESHDPIDENLDVYEALNGKWCPCKGLHGQKAGSLVVIRRLPVWEPTPVCNSINHRRTP